MFIKFAFANVNLWLSQDYLNNGYDIFILLMLKNLPSNILLITIYLIF